MCPVCVCVCLICVSFFFRCWKWFGSVQVGSWYIYFVLKETTLEKKREKKTKGM